jgi:hypothetical protein
MLYCWILGSFICFVCDFSFLWLIKGIALKPIMLNAWKKMIPFWRKTIIGVVVSCFSVYLCLYFGSFKYISFTFVGLLLHIYAVDTAMTIGRLICFCKICSCPSFAFKHYIYSLNMHILNPDCVKNAWEIGIIFVFNSKRFHDKTLHWNRQPHISALLFFYFMFLCLLIFKRMCQNVF